LLSYWAIHQEIQKNGADITKLGDQSPILRRMTNYTEQ